MRIFYCYTERDQTHAESVKPKDFDQMEHKREIPAENNTVAKMIYETDKNIEKWRK